MSFAQCFNKLFCVSDHAKDSNSDTASLSNSDTASLDLDFFASAPSNVSVNSGNVPIVGSAHRTCSTVFFNKFFSVLFPAINSSF